MTWLKPRQESNERALGAHAPPATVERRQRPAGVAAVLHLSQSVWIDPGSGAAYTHCSP
ncbi:MAG: hypothetical protein V3T70_05705 [Phycisphaerae bacterium]